MKSTSQQTIATAARQTSLYPRRLLLRWTALAAIGLVSVLAIWLTSDAASAQNATGKKKAAKVEVAVRPTPGAGQKLDAGALAKIIDQEINSRLQEEKIPASARSDDAEFLRRVYLDLVGVIPSADKVKAFLNSKDVNKRTQVVEELLTDSRYGKSMAEVWTNVMVPREANNRRLDSSPLQQWMTEQLNDNKPWNQLVYDLVTASGPIDKNGAVSFYVGNPTPDKMTDTVTKLFLGVRLQCAQCHDHPFTGWKQNEYWAMAAFFMKTKLNANPQQAAKKGITIEVNESPLAKAGKKKGLPEGARFVPAKFLQGEQPKMNATAPSRPVLATWMTSTKNPFFARALVNRMWHHFFGRGLVNPVDDMHADNPASHPELLTAMSEQFASNGFDVKYVIRAIVLSDAYQRTSRPIKGNKGNEADTELFSHAAVRVMSPEQMYDSLTSVVGNFKGGVGKKGAGGKKGPGGPREQFINFFRVDDDADPVEYQAGIPQALRLMNAPQMNSNAGLVEQAAKAKNPEQAIDMLFMATVSRHPDADEIGRLTSYVGKQSSPRSAYGDILWALLNSGEFATNH